MLESNVSKKGGRRQQLSPTTAVADDSCRRLAPFYLRLSSPLIPHVAYRLVTPQLTLLSRGSKTSACLHLALPHPLTFSSPATSTFIFFVVCSPPLHCSSGRMPRLAPSGIRVHPLFRLVVVLCRGGLRMRHRCLPGCLCGATFVFKMSQSQKAILSLMCLKR